MSIEKLVEVLNCQGINMISKELLSEVLGLTNSGIIDEIYQEDNLLYFCQLNKGINIYELAHKCKEWAYDKGWWIQSGLRGAGGAYAEYGMYHESHPILIDSLGRTDTEPEAILKSCQWILENKD